MSQLWFQIYEARFGKRLSDTEVAVWEDEIAREVRNLGASDVIDAVRRIAEERRKAGEVGKKYAPTVENIITEIIRGKWMKANPTSTEPSHTVLVRDRDTGDGHWRYEREPESEWKSRLHGLRDPDLAWSIICEPCNPDECRERRDYADSHQVDYQRLRHGVRGEVERVTRAVAA